MNRHARRTGGRSAVVAVVVVVSLLAAWADGLPAASAAPAAAGPATQPSAADRAVAAQLARKLPEVKFVDVGFADVIDFFRDVSGANLFVDWRRLEEAKIDRNKPVNLAMRDVKFGDALTRILDLVGGVNQPLAYVSSEGVLVISTPAGLDAFAAAGRAAAVGVAGADPKSRAVLDRKLPEVKFDGVGLADVLDFMKDVGGIPVDADWKQLAAAGVDRDAPVTTRAYNVTFEQNLRLILWSVGADRPLTYAVRNGRIAVTAGPKAEPPKGGPPKADSPK